MNFYVFDCEVYSNFFCCNVLGKDFKKSFNEKEVIKWIDSLGAGDYLVGFNSREYDLRVLDKLRFLLQLDLSSDVLNSQLKSFSNIVIDDKATEEHPFGQLDPWWNSFKGRRWKHVDIYQVSNLFVNKKGLKACAVALGMNIQELPYHHEAVLTEEQQEEVREYCWNDIAVTAELMRKYWKEILCRIHIEKKYGIQALEQGSAAVAENIFCQMYPGYDKKEIKAMVKPVTEILLGDIVPEISFGDIRIQKKFQEIKETVLREPYTLEEIWTIGKTQYKIGLGGLHSCDGPLLVLDNKGYIMEDWDFSSWYPSLIEQFKIHPSHLTEMYSEIVGQLKNQRIEQKKLGNETEASVYKLVLNSGAFGKMGEKHSAFFDLKAFYSVTMHGQFLMLFLIEKLESVGVSVISANTDGILINFKEEKKEEVHGLFREFEKTIGIELEHSVFVKYIRRDVNNYFAITDKGKIKGKGIFGEEDIKKKFDRKIVVDAVMEYFKTGKSSDQTIEECRDLKKFCSSFAVTKGWRFGVNSKVDLVDEKWQESEPMQKCNRWYSGFAQDCLVKLKDKRKIKVAGSDGFVLCNNLPEEFPRDINYLPYKVEARELIKELEAIRGDKWLNRRLNLSAAGLSLIPKNGKHNIAGAKIREGVKTWSDADYTLATGFGCYTGYEPGTLVIDIDDLEKYRESVFFGIFNNTMEVYRGEWDTVRGGQKRGSLVYICKDPGLIPANRTKKFGFEVMYTPGKTQTLAGISETDGLEYQLKGRIEEISKEALETLKRFQTPSEVKRYAERDLEETGEMGDLLKFAAQEFPKVQWRKKQHFLVAYCPFEDHTNAQRTDYALFHREDQQMVIGKCFHENCVGNSKVWKINQKK